MLFAPAVVDAHSAHFGGGSVLFWLLARDFNPDNPLGRE
jgi:hypothetical protein